jgi:hypothetical protein
MLAHITDAKAQCVEGIMRDFDASPEAIAFFDQTGRLLVAFHELGTVDLGENFDPWRANSNHDWVILNGRPALVLPSADQSLIAGDPAYLALASLFPSLQLWSLAYDFESVGTAEGAAQRFVLRFALVNGCRICRTGYLVRVAFDFTSSGAYEGARVLGICSAEETASYEAPCPPSQG